MNRKASLFALVLATMLLCASSIGFTANAAKAPNCATTCFSNFTACKNACAGDPTCLAECQADFDCCRIMCHGHECLTKSPAPPPADAE